jgi:DNA-directed RNA polymerase specialized sigma24 family protein
VFVRALGAIAQYRGGSVGAWLFRIARSVVANYHRDRRMTVPLDAVGWNTSDRGHPLDDHLAHADDIALARELVAGLPDDERELLDLRFNAALTSREIDAITGTESGYGTWQAPSHLRTAARTV